MRVSSPRRWLVPALVLLSACDGCDLSSLASLLPFSVPFLTQDAGVTTTGTVSGSLDAAGFFDDAGVTLPAEGEDCEPSLCDGQGRGCCAEGENLRCVDVT